MLGDHLRLVSNRGCHVPSFSSSDVVCVFAKSKIITRKPLFIQECRPAPAPCSRAAAGAQNKAIVQQFTANANASGQYVIQTTNVANQSLISGIEIQ